MTCLYLPFTHMCIFAIKVPTSCSPMVLYEKVKCKKYTCSLQDPVWTWETLILYLLICLLRKNKQTKKTTKVNKYSENGLSFFWIQYHDGEKSHDIASHQLALLKLHLTHWIQKKKQVRRCLVYGPLPLFQDNWRFFFQIDAESFRLPVFLPY